MEVIKLLDEQRKNLCEELAKIVFQLKKNENVECIYFAPYKRLGEIGNNILDVTVVLRCIYDDGNNKDIEKQNKIYFEENSLIKYGLKIFINTDDSRKYTIIDLNPSEVMRSNYLFNSTILYDKTGKYTELKKRVDKNGVNKLAGIYYYENLASIEPPIIDDLNRVMEVNQMSMDTETVLDLNYLVGLKECKL